MPSSSNKILLQAARGQKTEHIPLWLMRQAGRYLPEYREYRSRYDTLTMFKTPTIASEITLQPLRRFPLDGAIIYADILLIPDAMGLGLSFVEKEGPRFAHTVRGAVDFELMQKNSENLETLIDRLSYVGETVTRVKQQLDPSVTLIGFAGAPFTVASYLIEGRGPSKNDFFETKKLMFNQPQLFHAIMERLTVVTMAYLDMQIAAGVEIVQLFESWSGALAPVHYREFCLPYMKKIIAHAQTKVPTICFMGQGAGLVSDVLSLKPDVFGVDWRQDLRVVSNQFHSSKIALQGNLDPLLLYSDRDVLQKNVETCLEQGASHPHGYIFNLGHGCTPQTPVENVQLVVDLVHKFKPFQQFS